MARRVASTRRIKSVMLRACETKESTQYTSTLQQLFHDRTYYTGQLLATTQGFTAGDGVADATNNRIGDQVIARGLKFKVYIENEAARPNVMYRIFLFKYNTNEEGIPHFILSPIYISNAQARSSREQ